MKGVYLVPWLALATCVCGDANAEPPPPVVPLARVAMGPAFHFAADPLVSYALDVTAGVAASTNWVEPGWVVNPELGYSFDSYQDNFHAFNATVGVGFGSALMAVTYNPRLLLGTHGDDFAVAMRNSLVFHAFADLASMEVGHQFASYRDDLHQDIRILAGVNVGALVYIIAGISNAIL